MIPAPRGLSALFQVEDDTIAGPVVAFDDRGCAMVIRMEKGRLVSVDQIPDFVSLVWDEPEVSM